MATQKREPGPVKRIQKCIIPVITTRIIIAREIVAKQVMHDLYALAMKVLVLKVTRLRVCFGLRGCFGFS